MTYPQGGDDHPRTELLVDGTWTDLASMGASVRGEGGTSGITITHGRAEAQQRVSAQTSSFRFSNPAGVISNRNPSSPYYGKLPRNTQVRHLAGAAQTFLRCPYDDQGVSNAARTADKAVLDITGDLELRVDVWPHTWRPDGNSDGQRLMILASKYQLSGNQRSWALHLSTDGTIGLVWTTGGTLATRVDATSTAAVPATSGRLSIKVTLDVNNGAAGNDVKFWTASSIDGVYTQLGATITTGGVTSVFSSSADLCVGVGDDIATIFGGFTYGGRFYELRVYNGIGGTLVANPVFSDETLGATSFSDGLATPNTWTLEGQARVCSDRVRFHGELAALTHSWDPTGSDIVTAAQAAGMLRRLSVAGTPLRSPLFRQLDQFDSLVGWWPMEDAAGATSLASGLSGGLRAPIINVTTGNSSTLPGASTTIAFNAASGSINATCRSSTVTGIVSLMMFVKVSTFPASNSTFFQLFTTGTARRIDIGLDASNWRFDFWAADGSSLDSSTVSAASISPVGQWIGVNLLLETSGANVNWSARWLVVGRGAAFSGIGPAAYAGSVGRATQARFVSHASGTYSDAQFSHLLLANDDIGFVSTVISDATNAYVGETAADRIDRLCSEEGVAVEITGMWNTSAAMGEQAVASLADLLYTCAEADLGMLGESRNTLALTYRTRGDLDARRDLEISYTDSVLDVPPVIPEDDLGVTNDLTASRPSGSSSRFVIESGEMSVLDPPDGIGRYGRSYTATVDTDEQLEDVAGWLAHTGSAPDPRISNIGLSLHRTAIADGSSLAARIMALDAGDTVAITDLPVPLPPDDALLLVQGYQETLTKKLWTITANTTAGSVHRTGIYDIDTVNGYARYDTAGSFLSAGISSSGTTIILASDGVTWTDDAGQYPFDIMLGGERITLTAVGGATSPQTFTSCTRSVNGVVKAHDSGTAAFLAEPVHYAIEQ